MTGEYASKLLERVGAVSTSLDDSYGDVLVRKVVPTVEDGEDGPTIVLRLVLGNPTEATWPLEDVLTLRRAIRDAVREAGVEVPVVLRYELESDLPQEDDASTLFPL